MTVFILWRKIENCNFIEMICDEVKLFKQQYAIHKHLTKNEKEYYWTREKLITDFYNI